MYEWQKQIQIIVDEIDKCIKNYNDEALTCTLFPAGWVILNFIQQGNSKKYQVCSSGIICGTGNWPSR